ncbi:MAG: hypothetical protein Q9220_004823 [cf. Caloplaca sp. 1 TL-2023]
MTVEAVQFAYRLLDAEPTPYAVFGLSIRLSEISPDRRNGQPAAHASYFFDPSWYEQFKSARKNLSSSSDRHRVFLALGSNVGDRIGMIEQACKEMSRRGLDVRRTSSIFETEAMYKTDQQPFLNGACEIETTLAPLQLLDELKDIESSLGRVKMVENGPRSIDLDILLYGNETMNEQRLQIPHPRISEREFVLRPLCDLIPKSFLPLPNILLSFSDQLSQLPPPSTPLSPLTPLTRITSSSSPPPSHSTSHPQPLQTLTSTLPTRPTHIMAILNLTPDSFSNDGLHPKTPEEDFDPSTLLPQLNSLLTHRIPILDIGGQSTRPHAAPLSAADELARILPTIKFIRSKPEFNTLLLSIDTYHSLVARAAVEAGADIINDVSAGLLDKDMLPTIAELGCTYIMMHMRGTPETMNTLTSYPSDDVVAGVATELSSRVQAAMAAGIRRWRIILDPGIGFAKTGPQNLELIRNLPRLREWDGLRGLPWCVGVSRKAFVGKVAGVEGDGVGERVWGTAGAVAGCVAGGADLVRVHDWGEMGRVVRMAEAVWRV